MKHVGQFTTIQCGETNFNDILKTRLFPLSLSDAAFTWFTSLPPNSLYSWSQLEKRFHEYFFTGETELKLSHLTSVKQKINESVADYIRRFRDTRNRCYSLTISDRDLADLTFSGLLDCHKEKLENQDLCDVSQVLQKAMANENRVKEFKQVQKLNKKINHPVYTVGCESNKMDNNDHNVYAAKFSWLSKASSHPCDSPKPIHKNRQEKMKFTFNIAKYDRIFDKLHKRGYIKMSHVISPLDELKQRVYCK